MSMNICSDGHDEVCHEGRECPACKALAELDRYVNDLREANSRIAELEADRDE
jgi:hypothetical protein